MLDIYRVFLTVSHKVYDSAQSYTIPRTFRELQLSGRWFLLGVGYTIPRTFSVLEHTISMLLLYHFIQSLETLA